jgi:hypothetical protein
MSFPVIHRSLPIVASFLSIPEKILVEMVNRRLIQFRCDPGFGPMDWGYPPGHPNLDARYAKLSIELAAYNYNLYLEGLKAKDPWATLEARINRGKAYNEPEATRVGLKALRRYCVAHGIAGIESIDFELEQLGEVRRSDAESIAP